MPDIRRYHAVAPALLRQRLRGGWAIYSCPVYSGGRRQPSPMITWTDDRVHAFGLVSRLLLGDDAGARRVLEWASSRPAPTLITHLVARREAGSCPRD